MALLWAFIFGLLAPLGDALLPRIVCGVMCFIIGAIVYRISQVNNSIRTCTASEITTSIERINAYRNEILIRNDKVRIGDTERNYVIAQLEQHYVEGRLKQDELNERCTLAMNAVVGEDLYTLTLDLPPLSVPVQAQSHVVRFESR